MGLNSPSSSIFIPLTDYFSYFNTHSRMSLLKTLLFAALLVPGSLVAQTTMPNVLNLRSANSMGTIINEDKVVGYYVFYIREQIDKETMAYEVDLFDDNYTFTSNFEIISPIKTELTEVVYTGSVFVFRFYDSHTGIELMTYDKTGKLLGKVMIEKDRLSKSEIDRIEESNKMGTDNVSVYPMGTAQFLQITLVKNKKTGYEITAYDTELKPLWICQSDETSELVEVSEIIDVTEEVITAVVYKKKSNDSWNSDVFCLLIDAKTGNKIKEFELASKEIGQRAILKSFVDTAQQHIVIIGEYYQPGEEHTSNKSEGLFVTTLDMQGNEIGNKPFSWKGDIDTFITENIDEDDKKHPDKHYSVFFHDVVVSENGHIFLIGEQFQKSYAPIGITNTLISNPSVKALPGSSNQVMGILIKNMVVIELDSAKNLVDFDVIQKGKQFINVPNGLLSNANIGRYINACNLFDYAFTSRDTQTDQFDIIYLDVFRKEEKGTWTSNDLMIGVISIHEGEKTTTRFPINSDAKYFMLQAAKPGYISIAEYFRKEMKLTFRLEALSN